MPSFSFNRNTGNATADKGEVSYSYEKVQKRAAMLYRAAIKSFNVERTLPPEVASTTPLREQSTEASIAALTHAVDAGILQYQADQARAAISRETQ